MFKTYIGIIGKVIMVTIGTGLGTRVFYNWQLIPNIELGRIFYENGRPIEFYTAGPTRKKDNLDLEGWSLRLDFFLKHLKRVIVSEHFIIGGGLRMKFPLFKERLALDVPLYLAKFGNNAVIISASL